MSGSTVSAVTELLVNILLGSCSLLIFSWIIVTVATLYMVSLDELVLQKLSEKSLQQNSKVMGMLEVGNNGQIRLPDEVMSLFDIHTGENVLLLADKAQGIAIVKCSQFDRKDSGNGDDN